MAAGGVVDVEDVRGAGAACRVTEEDKKAAEAESGVGTGLEETEGDVEEEEDRAMTLGGADGLEAMVRC